MARTSRHPKEGVFNFRVDPALKAEFTLAAEVEKKPVAELLRGFMQDFVSRSKRKRFEAEARRQSQIISSSPEEAEVMNWIHDVSDTEGWK